MQTDGGTKRPVDSGFIGSWDDGRFSFPAADQYAVVFLSMYTFFMLSMSGNRRTNTAVDQRLICVLSAGRNPLLFLASDKWTDVFFAFVNLLDPRHVQEI